MPDYTPTTFRGLTFHDVIPAFHNGTDTPRHYLERCINVIKTREPTVKAFASLNEDSARAAADASTTRYKNGRIISTIDGMPISIKDLLETKDMPTQMGCEAYTGNFPKKDNAAVWALRHAGAVVFGKTVTAEMGGTHPGPTTNPFDPKRTPGGSSSGSAAAVATGMVPAAIGTQVGGSIIRPAGFCGNIALKPTQGAINRGERQATSMSTHGVHANCIEDMWQLASEIVKRVGGDRGCPGIYGPSSPPASFKPERLIVLETAGWAKLDETSRSAFESILNNLQTAEITLLHRRDNILVDALELNITDAAEICNKITRWENRWALQNLVENKGEFISDRLKANHKLACEMGHDEYRSALVIRDVAQHCHSAIANLADAVITLSCPGPAPIWNGDNQGLPLTHHPTGDAIFNYPGSMLFAPCVTLPLIAVNGLPVGIQVMGQQHQDLRVTAIARWILENISPISIA